MSSKRFKKLPQDTKELKAEVFEKIISDVKKTAQQNSMSQQTYLYKLITNKKKMKLI